MAVPCRANVIRRGLGSTGCFWPIEYIKKQKPQGIILPLDSLAVLGGLIVFSVIPLLLNGTKDLSVITMYVKELILFLLGVGLYNAFYANANGQKRVVRDLQIGVVVQFVVGIIGLLGASFMIRFLAFDQCGVTCTFLWFRAGISLI